MPRAMGGRLVAAHPWRRGSLFEEAGLDQVFFGGSFQVFCAEAIEASDVFGPGCFVERLLAEDKLHNALTVEADEVSGIGRRVNHTGACHLGKRLGEEFGIVSLRVYITAVGSLVSWGRGCPF